MDRLSHQIFIFIGIVCYLFAAGARADILTFQGVKPLDAATDGIQAPVQGAVSDDGLYLYAVDPQLNALTVFKRNSGDTLTKEASYTQGDAGVDGLLVPWKIALSPQAVDGNRYLYVIARPSTSSPGGSDLDSLAVYQRDTVTGHLIFVDVIRDDAAVALMKKPSDIAISPDGEHAYVTGEADNSIAVFHLDTSSNKLNLIKVLDSSTVTELQAPAAMTISADGQHAYVASLTNNAILEFYRNIATGELTFIGSVKNGDIATSGTIVGLSAPIAVAMSHDGAYLYAAALSGDAVVAFSRNSSTGLLDYMQTYSDGGAGVDTFLGLKGILDLHVSANDEMLTTLGSSSLTALIRNKDTGEIKLFNGLVNDNASGDYAISNSPGSVLTPDSSALYTISSGNRIGIFSIKACDALNPIAQASTVASVDEGTTTPVTLDGSASAAYCGSITSYFWEQIAGPTVALQNATSSVASIIPPTAVNGDTNLTFRLTVTDSNSLTNSTEITVNVIDVTIDTPPVAVADMCIVQPDAEVEIPVLQNDIDDKGADNLTIVSQPLPPDLQGSLVYSDKSITYKAPVTLAAGSEALVEQFDYGVNDGVNNSATNASVRVLVTRLPGLSNDDVVAQSGADNKILVLANDTLFDHATAVLSIVNTTSDKGGSLAVNADGSVTYTPPPSLVSGQDSFQYSVTSEAIKNFAVSNGLALVSSNNPCLQTIKTAMVSITVQQEPVANNKPGGGGGVSNKPTGGGSGGGAFDPVALVLLMLASFFLVWLRNRSTNNYS